MDGYRSSDWKSYREQIIRLDGSICARCGRGPNDGVVLQVHHKYYVPNKKPWEYPPSACETLCSRCHAEEHGKVPPRFGWDFVGWEDLGDLIGTCELCGKTIRHIFLVQHEKWLAIEVGRVCCDHLTDTQIASDHVDSMRRFSERRRRFVSSSRWASCSNTEEIRQKGIDLAIVRVGDTFKLRMNGVDGKKVFTSALDAKIASFDLIESGEIDKYFEKKNKKNLKP